MAASVAYESMLLPSSVGVQAGLDTELVGPDFREHSRLAIFQIHREERGGHDEWFLHLPIRQHTNRIGSGRLGQFGGGGGGGCMSAARRLHRQLASDEYHRGQSSDSKGGVGHGGRLSNQPRVEAHDGGR